MINKIVMGVLGILVILFGISLIPAKQWPLLSAADASAQIFIGTGTCSGTYIEDPITSDGIQTTILTAKHCAKAKQFWVAQDTYVDGEDVNPETKLFTIKVISKNSDLMLLQSEDWVREGPIAHISNTDVALGDPGVAVGYPLGTGLTITEGRFWDITEMPREFIGDTSTSGKFRRMTAMISPGSSGGGAYKLTGLGYELVGVATAIIGNGGGSHLGFWTPLSEIKTFLKNTKEKFDGPSE